MSQILDRRVLITGVDTVLGSAVRTLFDKRGARTFGTCRWADDVTATTMCVDPTSNSDVSGAVDAAVASMGGVDVLVVAHPIPFIGGICDMPMSDFWAHVDDTLTGSFLVTTAVARAMRDAGTGGRVVLTASRWHIGGERLSAVASAAGGLVALTKTLTRDLGGFGIGVNAVAIGAVDSEWSVCDAGADSVPLGVGSVGQVAKVIELLCDAQLGAAVGQVVNVDGGSSRNRV